MPALISVDPGELPAAKGAGPPANAPRSPMMVQSAEKTLSKPKALRIPEHYQEAEKSGLTYQVQEGNQTYNIGLE
jgi:hypothetical protein